MTETGNYQQEKLTIDLSWANIFGLLMLIPVLIVYGLPYYLIWGDEFSLSWVKEFFRSHPFDLANYVLVMFAVLFGGIVMHELIHGITWAFSAKSGFRSIRFGILWKMLTPYCHCKEPLKVSQYMTGALMPALVLGFFPAIAALITGSAFLLIFGVFFTMAASGDFLVVNLIRKEKMNTLVLDHPSEAGCYVFRKPGNSDFAEDKPEF